MKIILELPAEYSIHKNCNIDFVLPLNDDDLAKVSRRMHFAIFTRSCVHGLREKALQDVVPRKPRQKPNHDRL